MPIYTEEQKRKGLMAAGYDPAQYDVQVDEQDNATIIPRNNVSPSLGQPSTSGSYMSPSAGTAGDAFIHSAAHSALPAAVGGATAAGTGALLEAALAPETGGLSLIPLAGGLLAGLGSSYLTAKAQPSIIQALPNAIGGGDAGLQQYQQQEANMAQHPYASATGGALANLAGGMLPSPSNLIVAGKTVLNPYKLLGGTATPAELSNLVNVGLGAGLPVATTLGEHAYSGTPINPAQLALESGLGALFNKQMFHGGASPEASLANGYQGGEALQQNRPAYNIPSATASDVSLRPEDIFAQQIQNRINAQPSKANLSSESSINKMLGPTAKWISHDTYFPQQEELNRMQAEGGPTTQEVEPVVNKRQEDFSKAKTELQVQQLRQADLMRQWQTKSTAKAATQLEHRNNLMEDWLNAPEQGPALPYETTRPLNADEISNANLSAKVEPSLVNKPVEPTLENKDNTLEQQKANETLNTPPTEAEQIQEQFDNSTRHQPTVEDKVAQNNRLSDWLNSYFKQHGERRNITVDNTNGNLMDEEGNPVNGSALLRERLVKIAKDAPVDTWPHEFVHMSIHDMLTSPNATQRKVAQRLISESIPKMPEYQEALKSNPSLDPEEFITQLSGEQLKGVFLNMAEGEKGVKYSNWQKFKDVVANRWGNPTAEQTSKFLNEIMMTSPSYGETHPTTGVGTNTNVVKNQDQKEATFVGHQEGLDNEKIPLYNVHKDIVDSEGKVVVPKNGTVSQKTLDKYGVRYQSKDLTIKGIESGEDALRRGGDKQKNVVADSLDAMLKEKQELLGKAHNKVIEALKATSKQQEDNILKALVLSDRTKTDTIGMLSSYKEKQAYKTIRDALFNDVGQFRTSNNLPVTTGAGTKRAAGQDPNYFPNVIDPKVALDIKENRDGQYEQDFLNHSATNGISPTEAKSRWEDLKSIIRGDLDNPSTGGQASTYFNAIRKAEGIGLPDSMINKSLRDTMSSYLNRATTDLTWAKHIESDPYVAKSLGYKSDPWDKPLVGVDEVPSIIGQKPVANAVHTILKQHSNDYSDVTAHKLESAATATFLGPLTEIHKMTTNFFNGLASAGSPKEVVGALTSALSNFKDNYTKALSSGNIRLNKNRAQDSLRILTDGEQLASKRIGAATELIRGAYTFGGTTDKITKTFLQGVGEYTIPHKITNALGGNKTAETFLRNLDPNIDLNQKFTTEDISNLASRFAGEIHGTHDIRTLPTWMLKDTEISAFMKLASWSILQTNNFTKHIITPAKSGNFTPLIMAAFGGALGGAVVKELREKTNDKVGNIPTMQELLAADSLKKQGMGGKSLEENNSILAYKLADLMSVGGFGGLIANVTKDGFDSAFKNKVQSGTIFPLDELVTSTGSIATEAASAIVNGDSDFFTIASKAMEDWIKTNSQLGRIAVSNYERLQGGQAEEKHITSEKTAALRRYKMIEGVPYEDQGSDNGGNPYLTLAANKFKQDKNLSTAVPEGIDLVTKTIDKYKDNPSVLKEKLDGLTNITDKTMPSQEEMPFEFARYLSYIATNNGKEAAAEAYKNYALSAAVNEVKKSVVPRL